MLTDRLDYKKIFVTASFLVILIFPLFYPVNVDAQGGRIPGLPGGGLDVDPECANVGGVPIPSAFCDPGGGAQSGGGRFGFFCGLFGFCGPAGETTAIGVILNVINLLLAISAILAVLFVIISGIKYILAGGNQETAESAKKSLGHAVLGLAIIILSFVIIRVLAEALIYGNVM